MTEYGLTSRVEHETELVLEKIFLVSRKELFEMFSSTKHLEHFWGPNGWELIDCSLDFTEEGEWFYGMRDLGLTPNDRPYETWRKVVFEKIDAPNQLVYTEYFADKKGEINRELPITKTTIDFVELDSNRTMIMSRTIFDSPEALQELLNRGMRESVAESLDRLSKYVTQ